MTEQECLDRMIAPGQVRPSKPWRGGVIQILVTHSCDRACINCTQGSQLAAPKWYMTPDQFKDACLSLRGYFGVVGLFGGNPALSPHFFDYCEIMRALVPADQRGIWCNNPITLVKAQEMKRTFNHRYSNLNVHLDRRAYEVFKEGWPECSPVGLDQDSQHSPPWVAMKDIGVSEEQRWELISGCDINQKWSAGIGVFRGELRAWFCEVAMAQAIHHQHEEDYPDTGVDPTVMYEVYVRRNPEERLETTVCRWWQMGMPSFTQQVRKHCHECGVPMRGHGELAMSKTGTEQTSQTHAAIFKPKTSGRRVELVTTPAQLGEPVGSVTSYLQNSAR